MKLYFEDLDEGRHFRGDDCVAELDEMLAFARRNDPAPIHTDEAAARESLYGGLIASGGYTVMLWYRSGIPILAEVAILGGLDWHIKLPRPVRPGDRLHAEVLVTGKTPSSKPDRGYVKTRQQILNQNDEAVFTAEVVWMVQTQPAG